MASKPSISERIKERVCPNCGASVLRKHLKGPSPTFCSKACKTEMNNRLTVEGRAVIAFLKAWRINRGSGPIAQASFQQAVETIDYFNQRDAKMGRPRADYHAASILKEGTKYIDRQRGPRWPKAKETAA